MYVIGHYSAVLGYGSVGQNKIRYSRLSHRASQTFHQQVGSVRIAQASFSTLRILYAIRHFEPITYSCGTTIFSSRSWSRLWILTARNSPTSSFATARTPIRSRAVWTTLETEFGRFPSDSRIELQSREAKTSLAQRDHAQQ